MNSAVRWVFSLVAAALLLYACIMFLDTRSEVQHARERVQELRETRETLRRDNESLFRQISLEPAEKDPD